ncbi:hypothetical protein Bca52824_093830 [Brassica carinata]|uniref:DUF7890 domain-containing protein n=1 Tax=Brassica carinata TaxID=52824 RepID=A0A8X7P3I6_BRACI|nr:hypothetical protein Bca52824_093830 [Brassica carinata]
MDTLTRCFNGLQERYESVLAANSTYRDDLDITLPLNASKVSVEPTKKTRCLQRAKRIDKSMRFEEEEEEMAKPLAKKEGQKPRKVVRFQLENNKIIEPKKPVTLDLDQELEPEEKPLEEKEGLHIVKGKEEVVRIKIKMTKKEAQRLLGKCKTIIAHVPVHQLQVSVAVVACNKERQENGSWLSKME